MTADVHVGDCLTTIPSVLEPGSADLVFTSPPYADARAYSRIHPDSYVEWIVEHLHPLLDVVRDTGWLVVNLNDRIAKTGPLKGQRHPYAVMTPVALQQDGWRWLETYIWAKPNAIPGSFGPRTKDAFEYVWAFARGPKPYFDLDAVRVPYATSPEDIARRARDDSGRAATEAGFGRDRSKTYLKGGADPGNVVSVPQSYNQHRGASGHTAPMPLDLARFFVKLMSPAAGLVVDPFAGSGTTGVAAVESGRSFVGVELHEDVAASAQARLHDASPLTDSERQRRRDAGRELIKHAHGTV